MIIQVAGHVRTVLAKLKQSECTASAGEFRFHGHTELTWSAAHPLNQVQRARAAVVSALRLHHGLRLKLDRTSRTASEIALQVRLNLARGCHLNKRTLNREACCQLSRSRVISRHLALSTGLFLVFVFGLRKSAGVCQCRFVLDVVQSSASVAAISVLFCTGWAAFGRPAAPKLDWKSSHHIVQT